MAHSAHDHAHDHDHAHEHDHDHEHGHLHGHGHGGHGHHGHHHGPPASERKLFWTLLLTGGFMIAEAIGGVMAGSLALLADAGHMLTDAAALLMAFTAVRAARRPATPQLSYGHHRWQVLAAFVNGLALLLLSAVIVAESLQRLLSPVPVQGAAVMLIAAIGLLVNVAAFGILSGGEQNLNVRAALAHVLGDLLGSVAALAAGALIWAFGWMAADPLLSILVALLMVRTGWSVARQSAHVLLEGAPDGLHEEAIASTLSAELPILHSVHHVHVWSLSDDKPVVTLHAVLKDHRDHDASLRQIEAVLRQRFGITHSTIQLEERDCEAEPGCCS